MKKDYRARNKKGDKQQETRQEENVAGDVLQDALILALDNTSYYWVVVPRASCHATPHRKFFHDYVLGDFGHVLLGDDEPCKIVGMCKVQIKFSSTAIRSSCSWKFGLLETYSSEISMSPTREV